MKAVKNNREYTITEAEKAFYQKQGFDIIGDNGQVIQYGAGKTVPYEQYQAVVDELNQLKANNANKPLEEMSKTELKAIADAAGVEYKSSTTSAELIELIKAKSAETEE